MKNVQQAVQNFNQGYSCSQSIVMSYGPTLGLSEDIAIRISAAFGGGIARRAEMCGAVSGALMILGLSLDVGQENPKEQSYLLAQEFIKRFHNKHDTVLCKELLGVDIGTPEGKKEAKERNLNVNLCAKLVQDAAEILEEMLPKA